MKKKRMHTALDVVVCAPAPIVPCQIWQPDYDTCCLLHVREKEFVPALHGMLSHWSAIDVYNVIIFIYVNDHAERAFKTQHVHLALCGNWVLQLTILCIRGYSDDIGRLEEDQNNCFISFMSHNLQLVLKTL